MSIGVKKIDCIFCCVRGCMFIILPRGRGCGARGRSAQCVRGDVMGHAGSKWLVGSGRKKYTGRVPYGFVATGEDARGK